MDGGVDEAPRANVNMEDGQGPYTVNMSRWHYYAVHNIQCTIYTIYTFHNTTFYIKYNTQRKATIIACQRGGYKKYIRNTNTHGCTQQTGQMVKRNTRNATRNGATE